MIKVLHLYDSFGCGGAEKRIISLVDNLNKMEIVNLITSPKGSYLYKEASKLKIQTPSLRIRSLLDLKGILGLIKLVKKEKIDILHVHQGKIFWPSIYVKWILGNRLKLVFHRRLDKRSKFISRHHYQFADQIIAVSESVRDNLIKFDKVLPSKIQLIYDGIEVNKKQVNRIREEYHLENKLIIGIVGGIGKPDGKGQRYLLEAASCLKNRFSHLHYLIVGDGSLKEDLEREVLKMKIDDIVTFTGYQENVYDFIKAMDIVCLLSCGTEALGNALIEAQLLGKPVIGTNLGGLKETFVDKKSGILIPPRNVPSLITALIELIENENKRQSMGSYGKEWAKRRFSIEGCCSAVKDIYLRILK